MPKIARFQSTPIMHRIVRHADVLYLGGIVAQDVSADIGEQTRQVCVRLKELLESVGSDTSKILSVVVYLSDFSQKSGMNEAWQTFFRPDDLPARATLGVSDLGEGVLLEVVATAAA